MKKEESYAAWVVAIVIFVLTITLGVLVGSSASPSHAELEATAAVIYFERRDAFVQVCLESERYTRAECIELAGKQ